MFSRISEFSDRSSSIRRCASRIIPCSAPHLLFQLGFESFQLFFGRFDCAQISADFRFDVVDMHFEKEPGMAFELERLPQNHAGRNSTPVVNLFQASRPSAFFSKSGFKQLTDSFFRLGFILAFDRNHQVRPFRSGQHQDSKYAFGIDLLIRVLRARGRYRLRNAEASRTSFAAARACNPSLLETRTG